MNGTMHPNVNTFCILMACIGTLATADQCDLITMMCYHTMAVRKVPPDNTETALVLILHE